MIACGWFFRRMASAHGQTCGFNCRVMLDCSALYRTVIHSGV